MRALPGVPVADAHVAQGLPARPKTYTGCVRIGIEIAGQHHLLVAVANTLLHKPRGCQGLQLALMLVV